MGTVLAVIAAAVVGALAAVGIIWASLIHNIKKWW